MRFTIFQTEEYVIDAEDAQGAFDRLDDMDEDDTAAAYQERKVKVVDEDGNEHPVDY